MNPHRSAEREVAAELYSLADECAETAAELEHHGDRRELEDLAHVCAELAEILRLPSLKEFQSWTPAERKAWRKQRGLYE